jgi:hypothetical protein
MPEAEVPDVEEVEELAKDPFTRRVAQTTAVYAVVLAIASLGGNNAMKDTILAQQEASNRWAYYQAKVIREHMYKNEVQRLDLMLAEREATMPKAAVQQAKKLRAAAAKKAKEYGSEKKEIMERAQKEEAIRDTGRKKDPYFDYAEVLLQISIIMASISILAQAHKVFYFSVCVAVLGVFLTINGFGLFFDIPLLGGD